MGKISKKYQRRTRLKKSIRRKISGTPEQPRLSVFRSNRSIYAQVIDDKAGITLASASSLSLGENSGNVNIEKAKEVGKLLAKAAKEKGVQKVVFDRNGYLYHGQVKSLAEGAREEGLEF